MTRVEVWRNATRVAKQNHVHHQSRPPSTGRFVWASSLGVGLPFVHEMSYASDEYTASIKTITPVRVVTVPDTSY